MYPSIDSKDWVPINRVERAAHLGANPCKAKVPTHYRLSITPCTVALNSGLDLLAHYRRSEPTSSVSEILDEQKPC